MAGERINHDAIRLLVYSLAIEQPTFTAPALSKMSHLPVSALSQRMPPSRQPGGQEMVFQANVRPDYQQQSAESNSRQRTSQAELYAKKPWMKNPQMLEGIVPDSEREGTNEDGIPRKLAWLAKHGYTIHTYEEMLTARIPAPQISRKERRRYLIERKKVIYENARFAREAAQSTERHPTTGPATTTSPRSAYSQSSHRHHTPEPAYSAPSPYPSGNSSRHGSVAPMSRHQSVAPQTGHNDQFDTASWMDASFGQVDPAFLPEAALPPDAVLMAEINELFTPEEQVMYGFVQPGHEQYMNVPDAYWQQGQAGGPQNAYSLYNQTGSCQAQYPRGMVVPEFPNYPAGQGGSSYGSSQYRR